MEKLNLNISKNRGYKYILLVFTYAFLAYFVKIMFESLSDSLLKTLSLLLFCSSITFTLLLITIKLKVQEFNVETKNIFTVSALIIICYSIFSLFKCTYLDQNGPWTSINVSMWLNHSEIKYVLNFYVGFFGFASTIGTWLYLSVNINSGKLIRGFGILCFVIIFSLLYFANKMPIPNG